MNSYNENLHSAVVTTLSLQEAGHNATKASLDASKLTLYYTGGARITSTEKLKGAQADFKALMLIKEQAVINNNIAVNLLASATKEQASVAQSVTNTSVAAANIQVAANAVLKLAGNMGSIFSMVNAADYHSDIYAQSKEAYVLMNNTAYTAERVSQLGMEASSLTAEVVSEIVANEAKATATAVGNVSKTACSNYDAVSATVDSDNDALAAASASEKVAEGTVETLNVDYYAEKKAYDLNNKQLNIGLKVPVNRLRKDSYVVTFDYYRSPFSLSQVKSEIDAVEEKIDQLQATGYPVSNYYIMLVKDNQKSTFSLSAAEGIVASAGNNNGVTTAQTCIKIPGAPDGKPRVEREVLISELLDTDGAEMQLGVKYVVFVMAELMTEYKKNINDFSDYLSAASSVFTLTDKLSSPKADDIKVDENLTLEFTLEEYEAYNVEYRCMFLPVSASLVKGLLSEAGLRSLETELERIERIAEIYDPQIAKLEAGINSLQSYLDPKENQLQTLDKQIKHASNKDKTALIKERTELKKEIDDLLKKIEEEEVELKAVQKEKTDTLAKVDPAAESKPGFFFDLAISEQVSREGYYPVKAEKVNTQNQAKGQDKKDPKVKLKGTLQITAAMNDNFGTPLMKNYTYIPVVLSYADTMVRAQFTNSLSRYADTDSFVFKTE